ncbi:MAG: hypothetical protein JW778_08465 [Candidatus Altiarchaeota archaeon]|nr:hypothetical protein [Candidatus Altiarchaeota archaeon]
MKVETKISRMSGNELLQFSGQRIFSLGLRDMSSALSYENMRYGLGKMMYALDSGDVYCVFGPDATITRNVGRWGSGFGYGAVIRWPDEGVFFPELRPNSCGMLLLRLDEMPSKEELIKKAAEVENSDIYLDGIKLTPDFGKGNHFFEFYKPLGVSPEVEDVMPKDGWYAIVHGSSPEMKDQIYGMIDDGEWVETPIGRISILDGQAGKEYYRRWEEFNGFSKRRREVLARAVLGNCEIVSNLTHQGLFSKNEVRLGCHDTMDGSYPKGKALFPVALRWDHPVYVFKGKENLSDDVLGMTGFYNRAEEVGLLDGLRNINILPHGGGYKINLQYSKIEVVKTGIGNHFIMSDTKPVSKVSEITETVKRGVSSFGEMIIMNPHELPFDYRGSSVIEKVMEYDLGTPVAKLQPMMTLKV